ncbi:MAG TPA: alpha/beta hydrolase-fold protein [Labilithrix sp.]|nr:alpha/beta hydrolase-fold protein [Labilithrix sp.]
MRSVASLRIAVTAVVGSAVALLVACGASEDGGARPADGADANGQGSSGGSSGSSGGTEASADASTSDAAADGPLDAGPDAAPAPCTRAAEARTAPASLYDALKSDLGGLIGDARTARVDTFLADVAAQGGTPLEDRNTGRSVFLVRGAPPSGPWSIVGSFVGWDKSLGLPMTALPDTDLFVVDTNVIPAGASHSYKLLSGSDDAGYAEDPLARNVVWDGVYRGAVTEYNVGQLAAIVHPSKLPANKGRLVVHGMVHGTMLGNDRKVYVYFPPRYDDGTCSNLPTIVFGDGNEALTRGDYAGIADGVYAATPALSAVLVFASLASPVVQQRVDEYSFGSGGSKGEAYVDFLASDLWLAVKSGYRVCSKQEARGLSGVSLGGLIATYAAFERPTEWGWVGAQSASYWWSGSALVTRAASTSPRIAVRFYLDSTDKAADNAFDVDAMATALSGKGYSYVRIKTPVAAADPHDWPFFKARAAGMLTHFRDNQIACD